MIEAVIFCVLNVERLAGQQGISALDFGQGSVVMRHLSICLTPFERSALVGEPVNADAALDQDMLEPRVSTVFPL